MPRRIDVAGALALLRTRDELYQNGLTDRQVRGLVESGELHRVRRGRYVFADDWTDLWNEGRHLIEVVAAHLNADGSRPVFWGPSAAVLHGLPLYRHAPKTVHVAILDSRHGRTRSGITWHHTEVIAEDIVEVEGIRCTSIDRTVVDLARTLTPEAAISAADSALRAEAVTMHVQDADIAHDWHARLSSRARATHGRGVRKARRAIAFADGRAQLPGESVSRLWLSVLGFRRFDLQMHVVGPEGENYWLDFGFFGARCFGEFDGQAKYLDEEMKAGMTTEQIVLEEKRREDIVRGVTGWRTARWGSPDIATIDAFGAKLSAFGIRPPG